MNWFKYILVFTIRLYQIFISPILGSNCKFYPSCSNYFKDAINYYGIFKGTAISVIRILKCNPIHNGGYDPLCEHKIKKEV